MKSLRTLVVCSVAIVALYSLSLSVTHAQSNTFTQSTNALNVKISSDNPIPGQRVDITLESYTFDIDSASIAWSVDGTIVSKGIGLNKITVTAPALGIKKSITVAVVDANNRRYSTKTQVGSGLVDLIVENDGYKHPFFKSKTPLAFQNTVKVIAVPHIANADGKEYDPASLVYQWKKEDGLVLRDQSGYGKQSISLEGDLVPRPYYLIVTASSRDGYAQAQGIINIEATSPSLSFYLIDPLYGPLWNNEVKGSVRIGSQKEVKLLATPYGFNSSKDIGASISFDWLINGYERPELSSTKLVSLRAPDDSKGSSQIELSVRGVIHILQTAGAHILATFDDTSATIPNQQVTF